MQKLIIGNWKMHPESIKEALKIYNETLKKITKIKPKNVSVSVCVPNIFLPELVKNKKSGLGLGVQNAHYLPNGALTGQVSIKMLSLYKPAYGLAGHSEVRAGGDDDEVVNQKVLEYLRHNIKPILCVGESVRDTNGQYLKFIKNQIENGLLGVAKKNLNNVVIAYEPIWAIGYEAKREATAEECQEVVIYIRKVLTDLFGVEGAKKIHVLYGGSVNTTDSVEFIEKGSVDGLLIGRSSLSVLDFIKIITDIEFYVKNRSKKNNSK